MDYQGSSAPSSPANSENSTTTIMDAAKFSDLVDTLKESIRILRKESARKDAEAAKKDAEFANREAKKDAAYAELLKEFSELRKKFDNLTSMLMQKQHLKEPELEEDNTRSSNQTNMDTLSPNDSSEEDEGNSTDQTIEEESNDGFQTVKRRKPKKKRRIIASSDEDSHPTKRIQADPVAAKKPQQQGQTTGKESDSGKSNPYRLSSNEFPSLPAKINANPLAPVLPPKVTTPVVTAKPPRAKAIPPIVISNAGKFTSISTLFRAKNIKYSSAVVVRNGVKIFPCTEADYRAATQVLDQNKEPFFTFRFPEEKLNHVVLRGAPIHLTKEEISEDLISQGVSPKSIIRWNYSNGKPMPMVLVLVPRTENTIFKIRLLCSFEVRPETQKSKARSTQCYNCQDHGHAAPCCHIPSKCVKCGGDHHTSVCKKTPEEPPKCANCQGEHPASFSGCPRHPSQIKPKTFTFKGWGTQDNARLAPAKPPVSAQKQATVPTTEAPPLPEALLAQFRQMMSEQMATFMTAVMASLKK